MIHANRIVTVGEQESTIDRPIILYRGDREVEIEFTLVGNEFMFSEEGNVIESVNASHGQLVLNTPSGEHMFSELAECNEGKVVFVVTKEMIDEFIEVGFYSFQIRLYDSAEMKSRVTIPPVMNGFDIRNPIAAEDEVNVVDQGLVDYARIFKDQSNEELPTFDWTGAYNKTEWAHHDVITENKLNKIEDALYSINTTTKELGVTIPNTLDQVKKDADKYVKEHIAEVEADVEEFERNLNTDVQKFKIDTNAEITDINNRVNDGLEDVKEFIESGVDKYITCSMLGMSTLDTGVSNYNLLCQAINSGYSILVDDIYNLVVTANNEITQNIRIIGKTQNAGFILSGSGNVFNLTPNCLSVMIEGVYFKSEQVIAIINAPVLSHRINSITFKRCIFEGAERAIYCIGNDTMNPKDGGYGVDVLIFNNNVCRNITSTFMNLTDVPHNKIEIRHNIIENFNYIFITVGMTNGHAYGSELTQTMRNIIVQYNKVVNDEEWFNPDNASGTYHCFVLYEGIRAIYEHNHIEGLKSRTAIALYDAYISATTVICRHNTWINNVCLTSKKTNSALMKSKGYGGIRVYDSNRYYMDADLHEKYNVDFEALKTKMFDNVSNTQWYITNNVIEIPYLTGQSSSSTYSLCNISDNTVRVKKWGNVLVAVNDKMDVIVKRNHIHISDTGFMTVCSQYSHAYVVSTIDISDNIFESNDGGMVVSDVRTERLIIKNNTWSTNNKNDPGKLRLVYGGTSKRYDICDNHVYHASTYFPFSLNAGHDIIYRNNIFHSKLSSSGEVNGFYFKVNDAIEFKPHRYRVNIDFMTADADYTFSFDFKVYIDENSNRHMVYTRSDGEFVDRNLEEAGLGYDNIKINYTNGPKLPFDITVPKPVFTSGTNALFYFTPACGDGVMNISIDSLELPNIPIDSIELP